MKYVQLSLLLMLLPFIGSIYPSEVGAGKFCATTEEKQAFDMRVLQSELMVAALSCGIEDDYNQFIRKFKPELTQKGNKLREYFARQYAGDGSFALNKFVTRMANKASARTLVYGSKERFCSIAASLVDYTLDLKPYQLADFTSSSHYADVHGITACDQLAQAK